MLAASVTVLAFALGFWVPSLLLRPPKSAEPVPTIQLSPQQQKEEGIVPKSGKLLLATLAIPEA
jgi:hypothetical protein